MRRGEYTFDQVDILLGQRRHVLDVIRSGSISTRSSTPTSNYSTSTTRRTDTASGDETIIASIGTDGASTATDSTAPPVQRTDSFNATTSRSTNKKATKKPNCAYQVCHTCRPIFYDRLHMSFEPVVQNEVPALSSAEMNKLPVHDPEVVKGLGLRGRAPPKLEPHSWAMSDGGESREYDFITEKVDWDGEGSGSSASSTSGCGDSVLDDAGEGGVTVV